MIDFFNISRDDTQVALVRFATKVNFLFPFTFYRSRSSLRNAVSRVDYTGGYTATGPALDIAHNYVFSRYYGARPSSDGVPRVLVLMTDGKSNVGVSPEIPAAALKASGVSIFVIGVGSNLDEGELRDIASTPLSDHLYRLRNFNDYAALVNRMRSVSCDGKTF